MNKRLTGIISRIAVILFAIMAGVGIYLFNAQAIAGNPLPMPFGVGGAVVRSGSMEPTLSVNDLVFVTEEENYEEGDIIVFRDGAHLILHRIVDINGGQIITQGDANNVADKPIDTSDILGKMVFHIPGLGMLIQMIKTPLGICVIFGLAILMSEASFRKKKEEDEKDFQNIKEEIRKLKKEKNEELEALRKEIKELKEEEGCGKS